MDGFRYEPFRPFSSLISGVEAGNQLQYGALRQRALGYAMEQEKAKRDAMKQYQATGDPKSLIPALTPEQALEAPARIQAQQLDLGLKASQYFDSIRPDLTWETYPKIRQEALSKFPDFAEQHFPPPEKMGGAENFDKWKWEKIEANARFKAMPQVIAAQGAKERAILTGEYGLKRAQTTGEYGLRRAEATGASRERAAQTTKEGRVEAAKISTSGKSQTQKPFSVFISDPEIAKLDPRDQVKAYYEYVAGAKETPLQAAKRGEAEVKTDLLKELLPDSAKKKEEKAAPTAGTRPVLNKRTNKIEYVNEELYQKIMKAQGK